MADDLRSDDGLSGFNSHHHRPVRRSETQRPLADREVPLGHQEQDARVLSPAVHSWLDGELPEASVRKGETGRLEAPSENAPAEPETSTVRAHMVGTFYWTPEKSSKPALALHQRVDKGQVVGLIEAMGIMNEVEADAEGQIVEIAVASGQPVEYGQTLLVLAP